MPPASHSKSNSSGRLLALPARLHGYLLQPDEPPRIILRKEVTMTGAPSFLPSFLTHVNNTHFPAASLNSTRAVLFLKSFLIIKWRNTINHSQTLAQHERSSGYVRKISHEGIQIINNDQNLCSTLCPVLDNQEVWRTGVKPERKRSVCKKPKGAWMNHREGNGVSQRARLYSSSQSLLEMIFLVVLWYKPGHNCRR